MSEASQLIYEQKNGYDVMPAEEEAVMNAYCEDYKVFLSRSKTERECVSNAVELLEAHGFKPLVRGQALNPGDKVYRSIGGKSLIAAVIGEKSLREGAAIAGGHIDSPRLDLRPVPFYESGEMALWKTHYYGGIRKYQWVSIPLELHGVVCKLDGSTVNVKIGGDPGDPLLTIPDLLPHLGDEQSKKPLYQAIGGEDLNIVIGSRPDADSSQKDRIKLAVLKLLNEKYGITEEDFLSAELSAVPAYEPVDVGLDRSMIGAYGQDDRVCSFAILKALLDVGDQVKRTAVGILTDKEEIGSYGVTGMDSAYFDMFMSDLCQAQEVNLNTCFEHSVCVSSDVSAAFDPNHPEVFEEKNNSHLNWGVGVCKYTGSRGKSGANDAPAELVGYLRRVFTKNNVIWHLTEIGRQDVGGGGTIALYMARRGIPTIDAGTPVLAMHAPFEVTAKLDCYMTYKAMRSIFLD